MKKKKLWVMNLIKIIFIPITADTYSVICIVTGDTEDSNSKISTKNLLYIYKYKHMLMWVGILW